MVARRAVFTALLGGYEQLNEQHVASESSVDFFCFTDDHSLVSHTWKIVPVSPVFPLDLPRSQRFVKLLGHELLDDYDELLYIDNSVTLRVDPAGILDDWLSGNDLAMVNHSFRDRVIDEFDAVDDSGFDDPARVSEQAQHYTLLYPQVLNEKPTWNGMFARRQTALVHQTMTLWFHHVLRYSRRDQLSSNVACSITEIQVRRVMIDNLDSPLHQWPTELGRKRDLNRIGPGVIGELRDEIELVRNDLELAVGELDATRLELTQTLSTISWRVTTPLRELRRLHFMRHRKKRRS